MILLPLVFPGQCFKVGVRSQNTKWPNWEFFKFLVTDNCQGIQILFGFFSYTRKHPFLYTCKHTFGGGGAVQLHQQVPKEGGWDTGVGRCGSISWIFIENPLSVQTTELNMT